VLVIYVCVCICVLCMCNMRACVRIRSRGTGARRRTECSRVAQLRDIVYLKRIILFRRTLLLNALYYIVNPSKSTFPPSNNRRFHPPVVQPKWDLHNNIPNEFQAYVFLVHPSAARITWARVPEVSSTKLFERDRVRW